MRTTDCVISGPPGEGGAEITGAADAGLTCEGLGTSSHMDVSCAGVDCHSGRPGATTFWQTFRLNLKSSLFKKKKRANSPAAESRPGELLAEAGPRECAVPPLRSFTFAVQLTHSLFLYFHITETELHLPKKPSFFF